MQIKTNILFCFWSDGLTLNSKIIRVNLQIEYHTRQQVFCVITAKVKYASKEDVASLDILCVCTKCC